MQIVGTMFLVSYFIKGEPRTHQIHMYQRGSKYLIEQLKFRDYLRDNKETRIEYEQLKLNLSKRNKNDKHQYAEAKTDFVKSILENYRYFSKYNIIRLFQFLLINILDK